MSSRHFDHHCDVTLLSPHGLFVSSSPVLNGHFGGSTHMTLRIISQINYIPCLSPEISLYTSFEFKCPLAY